MRYKMEHKLNLKYIFILVAYLFCCGFTTGLYDKAAPALDLPQGDPDPDKGIIVRPDSTAYDVLRESSSSVKLGVTTCCGRSDQKPKIMYVSAPFIDRQPKTFNYVDDNLSFSIKETFGHNLYFNERENKIWKSLRFHAFQPATFHYKEVVQKKLDEITSELEKTGWIDITDRYWSPFDWPKIAMSYNERSRGYKNYAFKDMRTIIYVSVGIPTVHKFTEDNPKYNIRIVMSKNKRESITS